jgi:hypothetical protein
MRKQIENFEKLESEKLTNRTINLVLLALSGIYLAYMIYVM